MPASNTSKQARENNYINFEPPTRDVPKYFFLLISTTNKHTRQALTSKESLAGNKFEFPRIYHGYLYEQSVSYKHYSSAPLVQSGDARRRDIPDEGAKPSLETYKDCSSPDNRI